MRTKRRFVPPKIQFQPSLLSKVALIIVFTTILHSQWVMSRSNNQAELDQPGADANTVQQTPTPSPQPEVNCNFSDCTLEDLSQLAGTPGAQLTTAFESLAVVTTEQSINVRSGPGTNYSVVSMSPPGTIMQVLGQNTFAAWVSVRLPDGSEGWIRSDLVALMPVEHNNEWTPVIHHFDGVSMMIVPAGCFDMGSDTEDDELPVNRQCFDHAFWIDRTEVTNRQFANFGGQAENSSSWTGDLRPRENINWFEARDFCILRGGRLPTEAEWEYAARGTDGLVYPWGNDFVAENVVYGSSDGQTADVASNPGGASWVGALDMSGNLWEWVSSAYKPYPFGSGDGRESDLDSTNILRVMRGGSWNYFQGNVRAAHRYGYDPSIRSFFVGFRCARDFSPTDLAG